MGKCLEKTVEEHLPASLAIAAYAVYSLYYGPWSAFSLVCLCGFCVSGARLLLSVVVQRGRQSTAGRSVVVQRGLQSTETSQPTAGVHEVRELTTPQKNVYFAALGFLGLLVVQVLVSPDTPWLLASRWYLLLVTPLLGVALHLIGTSRAELNETLVKSQTNYANGAAWGFFLGYLMIMFGKDEHDSTKSFSSRMDDYLTENKLDQEAPTTTKTYKDRLIILVPMKLEAHDKNDNDKNMRNNDESVTKEKRLHGIMSGGRLYGQIQIYTIEHHGHHYRVAMEEATPILTAALAAEDATVENFDKEDFDEFSRRFLTALQTILRSKPANKNILRNKLDIRDQVELVPIYDKHKISSTVVQRILDLEKLEKLEKEGNTAERQKLADRLTAAGSVAAR